MRHGRPHPSDHLGTLPRRANRSAPDAVRPPGLRDFDLRLDLGHHGGMLEVSFVRHRGSRDRVYVKRSDGTSIGWDFPSYGEGLPHDLCHLVVEDGLELSEGFWGLVDQHVDVGLVNNEPTLIRDGKPLVGQADVDFAGLVQAEGAVAVFTAPAVNVDQVGEFAVVQLDSPSVAAAPTDEIAQQLDFSLPESATPAAIAAIHDRLRELGLRWRSLYDGGSIKLTFPGSHR
jgi:hypothetical protein